MDVLLVLPAVLEDVVQDTEQERDVRSRTDADVLVGLGCRARETRVGDHDLAAGLLRVQRMQHRHRVRLGGIRADIERSLAVVHVVVGIGHRAVTPGIRDAGYRGRVADARLMVGVVGPEEPDPLAHQVGLLVGVLGGADEVKRVGAGLLAKGEHLVADLVDRRVPRDALVFAVHQLHRVFQPVRVLGHAVLAYRSALSAVRPEVERRIEHRFLAHPHAVLHYRVDRASDRAVRAYRALHFDLARLVVGGVGLADHIERQLSRKGARARRQPGALEEGAPVDRLRQHPGETARKTAVSGSKMSGSASGFPGEHHGCPSSGQTFAVL